MSIWDKIADKVVDKLVTAGVTTATGNPVAGKVAGDMAGKAAGKVADKATSGQRKGPGKYGLRGSQGWDDPELNLRPSAEETALLDIGLPIAGDIAKGVGTVLGNNSSLLGLALQAVHSANNPMVGNAIDDVVHAVGARNVAKGTNQKAIGDIAANRLYNVGSVLKSEREGARNKMYQMNEQVPGAMWEEYKGRSVQKN